MTSAPDPTTDGGAGAARPATPAARDLGAQDLASALGRVPSGLFVVATRGAAGPLGFVASFVQQVGFAPPTVMVAVAHGRDHLAAMRATGRFTVSVLGEGDRGLMKPFFKAPPTGSAFDALATEATPGGGVALADALAWLDCRVVAEHALADHAVVFAEVEAGRCTRAGEPAVHVRKNGLGY